MWRETRNSMDHLFEEISARVNDLLLDQGLWVTMVTISYKFRIFCRLHWLDSDRIFMCFIMMLWNFVVILLFTSLFNLCLFGLFPSQRQGYSSRKGNSLHILTFHAFSVRFSHQCPERGTCLRGEVESSDGRSIAKAAAKSWTCHPRSCITLQRGSAESQIAISQGLELGAMQRNVVKWRCLVFML